MVRYVFVTVVVVDVTDWFWWRGWPTIEDRSGRFKVRENTPLVSIRLKIPAVIKDGPDYAVILVGLAAMDRGGRHEKL